MMGTTVKEDFGSKPLEKNDQQRFMSWSRYINGKMAGEGIEDIKNSESISLKLKRERATLAVQERRSKIYLQWNDNLKGNRKERAYWQNRFAQTQDDRDWVAFEQWNAKVNGSDEVQGIIETWETREAERRKIETIQKKIEGLEKKEDTEIGRVGRIMQEIRRTTCEEINRAIAARTEGKEGIQDRVEQLKSALGTVLQLVHGVGVLAKERWRLNMTNLKKASTFGDLETLIENLTFMQHSIKAEEAIFPGTNPFSKDEYKLQLESKIDENGELTHVYSAMLHMDENISWEDMTKTLKDKYIDKSKLRKVQAGITDRDKESKIEDLRINRAEYSGRAPDGYRRPAESRRYYEREEESRGRGWDRRGNSYDKDRRSPERGWNPKVSPVRRGYSDRTNSPGRGGDYDRERRDCWEYESTGTCTYEKKTGHYCRFNHKKSGDRDREERERSRDGRGRSREGNDRGRDRGSRREEERQRDSPHSTDSRIGGRLTK